jgi:antitoxin MazE
MRTRVQKWGNSLAVRIPKAVATEANLTEGETVEIRPARGSVLLKAVRPRKYDLDELMAKVTKKNLHKEWDIGAPVGREVW